MKKKMQYLIPLGIIFLFLGTIFVIMGTFTQAKEPGKESSVKVGVGGFIGPIPFGFANDKKVMYAVVSLMVVLIILYIWMARRYF